MTRRTLQLALALVCAGVSLQARADATTDRLSVGGYFRLQGLTDFQGGNGRLGLGSYGCGLGGPCLYGRLLNEGPDAILLLRLSLLGNDKTSDEPWAAISARIEGESFLGTDAGNGGLSNYIVSIFALEAGNILLDKVTWKIGVLWYEPGDLGLYDLFLDDLFYGVVGASAFYKSKSFDWLVGAGDQGWFLHGANYDTVFTAGTWLRGRLGSHLEIGGGGQYGYEPSSPGNQNGPYQTPGLDYLDFYRHTFVQNYFQQLGTTANSGTLLPKPQPRASENWKLVGYLGFGKFGRLQWNNFYIHYLKQPPQTSYQETFTPTGASAAQTYTIYDHDLTDHNYELQLGDEAQFTLIRNYLDLTVAGLYGEERNTANTLVAGTDNINFMSTVARFQYYLTRTVHLLFESSLAHEVSLNGNLYREHVNSVFATDGNGVSNQLGLKFGDSNVRNTWQGKWGIIFNPNGPGIYNRPSLRLLYGLQYSSAQDAFQSGYVNTQNQYNEFVGPEQHWHSVVGVEAEGWF